MGMTVNEHVEVGTKVLIRMAIMIGISLGGPKVNPKAFELDSEMFKLKPSIIIMIVVTIFLLAAIYIKFW